MIERLDDGDWREAFYFAGPPHLAAVLGSDAPPTPFCREDVAEIIAASEGVNDEEEWLGVFRLRDGRYACLAAWCDYTGWDCQSGGDARVAWTLDEIVRLGLTDGHRARLGLTID